MNSIETQLKKARALNMSAEEKQTIRRRLVSHIEKVGAVPSPYLLPSPLWSHVATIARVVAVFLIVVLIGGGTLTYASEQTLPGDLLYPIKVRVKEELEVRLASSPEKKIALQKRRIEKRLEEVKIIQATGTLSEDQTESVREALVAHAEDLHKNVEKLQAEGKEEVVIAVAEDLLLTLTEFQEETASIATMSAATISTENTADTEDTGVASETVEVEEATNETTELSAALSMEVAKTKAEAEESLVELNAKHGTKTTPEDLLGGLIASDIISPTEESKPQALGSIEGSVRIAPVCVDEIVSEQCETPDASLEDRSVYVYTEDEITLVAKVALNKDGTFTIELPEGTYVLDLTRLSASESSTVLPYKVTIEKEKTVEVHIDVDLEASTLQ